MTRKVTFLIFACLLTVSAGAQEYFSRLGLNPAGKNDAASLALGGTAVSMEGSPIASLLNPAVMHPGHAGVSFYTNVNVLQNVERRSFPVQDYFGDYLIDNDYVSNRYSTFQGDAAMILSFEDMSFTAGWYTLENYSYHYKEQIRSDEGSGMYYRDPLAGVHLVDFSGSCQGLNVGLSHSVGHGFRVGYSYTALYGLGLEEGMGVVPYRSDPKLSSQDTTYRTVNPTNGGGGDLNVGLSGDINKRLRIGLSATMAGQFTIFDTQFMPYTDSTTMLPAYNMISDSTFNWDINRPNTYSLSMRFIPRNELKSHVYLQADLTDWSAYNIKMSNAVDTTWNPGYKAQWTFRAGVEHVFFTGIPIRFGFVYQNNPMSKELNKATISFGTGWISEKLTVNVGLAYNENLYYYYDLFPVEDEYRESLDKVRESSVRGNVSLVWRF